jgi:hypothetical protein
MNPSAQNMNRDPTPSVQPKTSLGAQSMKMGADDLGTADNEFGRAKQENGTLNPGTAENESGSAKHENGT